MSGLAPSEPDSVVAALIELACARTGFRRDAVPVQAIARLARQMVERGATRTELLSACARANPGLVDEVRRACLVNETSLFRQIEHFELVQEQLVPALLARRRQQGIERRPVRAWSAGCATGEEAWSLASSLLAATGAAADVDVLGTDVLAHHIAIAASGAPPTAHRRHAARHQVVDVDGLVLPALRPLLRFWVHDLRDPPPDDDFDLIFCRNVLLYLEPAIARAILAHLAGALRPGGVLILGPVDVDGVPAGLVRCSSPALTAFQRPLEGA